jgi:hypothetical protein
LQQWTRGTAWASFGCNGCESGTDDFVEQADSAADLISRFCLLVLRETSLVYQLGEVLNVRLEEHGVVQDFLMAFLAEDLRLAFGAPWALPEYGLSYRTAAVRGPAKEPLGNVMVLGGMRAALDIRFRVGSSFVVDPASAKGTALKVFALGSHGASSCLAPEGQTVF